jgi:hypothetical protein
MKSSIEITSKFLIIQKIIQKLYDVVTNIWFI